MDFTGENLKVTINAGEQPKVTFDETDLDNYSVLENIKKLETVARDRGLVLRTVGAATVKSAESKVKLDVFQSIPDVYDSYVATTKHLNAGRQKRSDKVAIEKLVKFSSAIMGQLEDPATLDYMVALVDADPELKFVPKPVANVPTTARQIMELAEANGELMSRPLYEWAGRAAFLGQFSELELSGTNPESGDLVHYGFAPTKLTSRLYGNVEHQRNELVAMNNENPGVSIVSPGPLRSVAGWDINRRLGLPLTFDALYDRSVNVEAKPSDPNQPAGAYLYVPASNVYGYDSSVDFSWADNDYYGRAWVGQNLNLAA